MGGVRDHAGRLHARLFRRARATSSGSTASSPPVKLVPEIHRSALSKWLRTVALVRYLRGNLSLRPDELIQLRRGADAAAAAAPCRNEVLSKRGRSAARGVRARIARGARACRPSASSWFSIRTARRSMPGKPGPRSRKCLARPARANDRLQELAAQAGMHVIDSYPVFQRHFAERLGPLDRSPLDAHWNPAAHRLMAREVARIIER